MVVKKLRFSLSVCLVLLVSLSIGGCDEPRKLTDEPISMDIYVDSTFSNEKVAHKCMPDVMAAARLTAGSRGYLSFHTFDGDPFRRRGINEPFTDGSVPLDVKGTSGEIESLEDQATELKPRIEKLIEEPAKVGGSPLLLVLERAARQTPRQDTLNLVLICTDGLFTDVNPLEMGDAEARAGGAALGSNLRGVTVDFIGLDGSAPGRGKRIEHTKPLVQAVLAGAGARFGNWGLEMPPDWRDKTIAAAGGSN
jgi:hypothetical protein